MQYASTDLRPPTSRLFPCARQRISSTTAMAGRASAAARAKTRTPRRTRRRSHASSARARPKSATRASPRTRSRAGRTTRAARSAALAAASRKRSADEPLEGLDSQADARQPDEPSRPRRVVLPLPRLLRGLLLPHARGEDRPSVVLPRLLDLRRRRRLDGRADNQTLETMNIARRDRKSTRLNS